MIQPGVLASFVETFAPHGFRAEALLPSYGMAEATLAISFAKLGAGVVTDEIDLRRLELEGRAVPATDDTVQRRRFVLCGAPLPGHDLQVRDGSGAALPDRQVGRILVRGPSVMLGYDGQPEKTAEVLSADGWLDTGDLGYLLGDEVVITGRAKDLIIVKGRNIWPQDLEWTAEAETEALRSGDVAVFSLDEEEAETVVVLVQCRSRDSEVRQNLRDEVARIIRARHGLEVRVVLVPPHALPQTSSGKLSRSSAKTQFLRGDFEPARESAATA